jgi:hypothetical protein
VASHGESPVTVQARDYLDLLTQRGV